MTQRSIQAEGVFANIKQNYEYTRLRRKGETDVKEEIYLVAIGYNIRKYYNHKLFVTALFLTELRYFKNPVRKTRKKYAIILKTI